MLFITIYRIKQPQIGGNYVKTDIVAGNVLPVLLAGSEKLVLVTGEWEPYTTEKSSEKGAFCEIVASVFQEMKTDIEIKLYPWKRAELMVVDGSATAAFPYVVSDERKKEFTFTDPVMNSTGKFFYIF